MIQSKKILSLLLALTLVLGLFSGLFSFSAATETKYGKAEELFTGEFVIVVPTVTPTGMEAGPYYVTHDTANNPGLLFAAFDEGNHDSADKWKITKVSDTQCTVQNESLGEEGYINMRADYIGYGAKMNLNYEFSGGKCRFFVNDGGKKWYIRFTNSSMNESRFQCGTGEASHEFYLYGNIPVVKEEAAPELEIPPVTGDPIFTIACISDLHADYGLQSGAPYVRNSVITMVNAIADQEKADILLVGGDMTSDNGKTADKGGWTYDIFSQVIAKYRELGDAATESGRSLWACGNHDYQAGEFEGYDAYADYEAIMVDSCGEPLSIYRQKDDKTLVSDQRYPDFVLGMHFNIDGFDFIVLNAPYQKAQTYSNGTLTWLKNRLQTIGKEKTAFILTHFPLTDSRNISTPSYGTSGTPYNSLVNLLRSYPNTVMLYGHNHGGTDNVYINDDTFERITSYNKQGKVVNDRNVVPTSFITAFMGSASYYNTSIDSGWLDEYDPNVVQGLMIYLYEDRMVFEMKNYGTTFGDKVLRSWTVMRDMVPETAPEPEEPEEKPDVTAEFLVTTEINDQVHYDSTKGIGKYNFTGTASVQSFGNQLTANQLPDDAKLNVRELTSGNEYSALKNALNSVVKQFVAYKFTLKQGSAEQELKDFVKITLPSLQDEFGPNTGDMQAAVYYLDGDGVLHMTDILVSEDGTMSFLLPELTPFAISAKANAADEPYVPQEKPPVVTEEPEVETTTDEPVVRSEGGNTVLWIVLAVVAVVLVGGGVAIFLLLGKKKSAVTESAKEE